MKVYISADIEGVVGVSHLDETDRLKADYNEFREQMTILKFYGCSPLSCS